MTIIEDICTVVSNKGIDLQHQLVRAAYCVENYKGFPSDAWDEDIQEINITQAQVLMLKATLFEFIKDNLDDPNVGTAIWVFGKIAVTDDKVFLVGLLKRYVDNNPQVLYQVMIALNNLGEVIFNEKSSSLIDYELNVNLAKKYLELEGLE
ncbi:MAG: hypothetical protein AB2826_26655 [Candidatus Thiodiazotropha sp.]